MFPMAGERYISWHVFNPWTIWSLHKDDKTTDANAPVSNTFVMILLFFMSMPRKFSYLASILVVPVANNISFQFSF